MLHKYLSKILLTILLINFANAQQTQAEVKQFLDISVGDWPPFLDRSLPHNGVVAQLISDVLAEEGYQVRFHFRPWPRAYLEASTGMRDATAIWMHKPEREKDFYYSQPVMEENFVFFHLKSKPFNWQSLQDLAGMTLGGGINYSYGPEFNAALDNGVFVLERVSSKEQNFKRLLLRRIDAFPEEITVGYHSLYRDLKESDYQQITHHPTPFLSNNSFLLFPKKKASSPALMEAFNKRLAAFRGSGRYAHYFDRLKETPSPSKSIDKISPILP